MHICAVGIRAVHRDQVLSTSGLTGGVWFFTSLKLGVAMGLDLANETRVEVTSCHLQVVAV